MKPFKTSLGVMLSASALFLMTSCSKNIGDQQAKTGTDVEQLATITGPVCHWKIGMQMRNNAGGSYFWVGPVRTDVNMQTAFSGLDFSNQSLMKVTAFGTSAVPSHAIVGEHLGVMSAADDPGNSADPTRVNVGETLVFNLGTGVSNYVMRGFSIQMNANTGTTGKIETFRDGGKQEEIAIVNSNPGQNFGIAHVAALNRNFDEIRFTATNGAFRINARNPNDPPLLNATEFYIVQNSGAFINQNNVAGAPFISGYTDGVVNPTKQTNNGAASGAPAFAFNAAPEYLKVLTNAPGGLVFSSSGMRIAGYTSGTANDVISIDPSESIWIEPGADFGATLFSGIEIRVAHKAGTNDPLRLSFWKNGVQVGTDMLTDGNDAAYNLFYSKDPFDQVFITGTGVGAAIGRPGIALRMIAGCE